MAKLFQDPPGHVRLPRLGIKMKPSHERKRQKENVNYDCVDVLNVDLFFDSEFSCCTCCNPVKGLSHITVTTLLFL